MDFLSIRKANAKGREKKVIGVAAGDGEVDAKEREKLKILSDPVIPRELCTPPGRNLFIDREWTLDTHTQQ